MIKTVTLGGTINLGNYESMRIEVTGENEKEVRDEISRILKNSHLPGSPEEALSQRWMKRSLNI